MKIGRQQIWVSILVISSLISGCKSAPIIPSITAGITHTCALTSDGIVKCWGDNEYGQLGDGTTTQRLTPVEVIGLTGKAIAIAAGGYHTCALISDGGVKCWGDNRFGQLGDGTTQQQLKPIGVIRLTTGIKSIAAGNYHTCAVTSGGVKCWGDNQSGALGDGTYIYGGQLTPVDVIGLKNNVKGIAAADGVTCAWIESGGATCWGSGFFGELGNGTTDWSLTPVNVSGLTNVVAIAGGDYHTCALTSDGGVKCWGSNTFGGIGNGEISQVSMFDPDFLTSGLYPTPVDVIGLTTGVKAIATGGRHTCALTLSGGVKCWGCNEAGQLGDGTILPMPPFTNGIPVDVIGLTSGVSAITAGGDHTCALLQDGTIKCWGTNFAGQLGNGTTMIQPTPVDVVLHQ